MSPKVTVIIPVYNVESYLREAVDSVLCQTLQDIEIILVDDGSTDNSGIICDEYAAADERVKVIHKPNGGLSSARNAGLEIAKGEYIMFLDSDDYWGKPTLIKELVDKFVKYPDADFIQFSVYTLSENKILKSGHPMSVTMSDEIHCDSQEAICRAFSENKLTPTSWDKIFRKKSIPETMRFIYGVYYEDEYFLIDIFRHLKKIILSPIGYYVYRIRSGSILHSGFNPKLRIDYLGKELYGAAYMKSNELCKELYFRYYFSSIRYYKNSLVLSSQIDLKRFRQPLRQLSPSWTSLYHVRNDYSLSERMAVTLIKIFGVKFIDNYIQVRKMFRRR